MKSIILLLLVAPFFACAQKFSQKDSVQITAIIGEIKTFYLISPGLLEEGLPGFEVTIESESGKTLTLPKATENKELLIEWLRANFSESETRVVS